MIKLSVLLAAVMALVLTFGTAGAQESADDPAQIEAGMAVFEANCASCHSSDGTGSAVGRPLTDVALEADRSVHIASVTDGKGGMPAFGAVLEVDEIDAVVSYVRLGFVSEAAAQEEEPPAEEEPAEEELAETGAESAPIAVAAIATVAAGAMLVATARRRPSLG